ncbi:MAG: site-2 protease family protein, partial [Acidobacteriota bacterium]|nr:site-2 protease family protein [Acidobacteriota bacterium]
SLGSERPQPGVAALLVAWHFGIRRWTKTRLRFPKLDVQPGGERGGGLGYNFRREVRMFSGPGWKIGRVMGIPIYVSWTWFFIFVLITETLATQFSTQHPGWTPTQHWAVGVITSLLFFGSVLFHELGHSVAALRYKMRVISITLFIFGGMARIAKEAERPMQEFNIAMAGPVASFLLAAIFYGLALPFSANSMFGSTCLYLAEINAVLGAFNLVPGMPLDGGRILRAIAWAVTKDPNRAMRVASRSGQFLAYLLILAGIVIAMQRGFWLQGLLWVFVGWFLLSAAQQSYAQVELRRMLDGLHAADVMSEELPTIDRTHSLEEFLHEVLRTGRRCHLVLGNNELVGLITLHNVRHIPREEWANTSIQAAMVPRDRIEWAQADEPAIGILERMQSNDINQMPVLREGQVVGMVSRDAMLRVIQTRMQLERFAQA